MYVGQENTAKLSEEIGAQLVHGSRIPAVEPVSRSNVGPGIRLGAWTLNSNARTSLLGLFCIRLALLWLLSGASCTNFLWLLCSKGSGPFQDPRRQLDCEIYILIAFVLGNIIVPEDLRWPAAK